MKATDARTLLLAQHERIRRQIEECTRLAKRHRAGEDVRRELDLALARLRDDFAAHNHAETAMIAELLRGSAGWGSLLLERMVEEHVAEHAAFWNLLSGTDAEVGARIDDLAEDLDAHMAAEERTFLSPLLRDEVIEARGRAPAAS